jgi:hypothetical protein
VVITVALFTEGDEQTRCEGRSGTGQCGEEWVVGDLGDGHGDWCAADAGC